MKTQSDHRWPAPIVIGLTSAGDLTFLLEEYATGAATEMDRWRTATTWSEARTLAARPEFVEPPFLLDDLTELVESRWPEGQGFGVGAVVDTVLNGPVLMMSADEEDALRGVLERAGRSVRRDDGLVRRASEV